MDGVQAGRDVSIVVYLGADTTVPLRRIERDDSGGVAVEGAPPAEDNPYVGLEALTEADSGRFFGREAIVDQLWDSFRDLLSGHNDKPRILPVLGPSGSGKSSVARAGLLPELARRPIPEVREPHVAIMRPRDAPLRELAQVLARIDPRDKRDSLKALEIEERLRRPAAGDASVWDGLSAEAGEVVGEGSLIVLVDQFEEIYTLTKDDEARRIFLANLLEAAGAPGGRVSVIITMRSDFIGATARNPDFNAVIAGQGVIVPTMTEVELREVIEAPASKAGRPLPRAVVDRLVDESRGRVGALPLLEFALEQLWTGMTKGEDPGEALARIGGVGGALAGEAERILNGFRPEEQQIARRAFMAMVSLGEGTQDTRRRASLSEMTAAGETVDEVHKVLAAFSRKGQRLISLSGGEEGLAAEVTHESLLEQWETLQEWLTENRTNIRFQRQINEAASEWEKAGRPKGMLWRPPLLTQLEDFRARNAVDMTERQLEFLIASRKDLSRSKIWRLGTAAVALVAVVALGFGWIAFQARKKSELFESIYLSDRSLSKTLEGDATAGIQLALAAMEKGQALSQGSARALTSALVNLREVWSVDLSGFDQKLHLAGFDPSVQYIVVRGELKDFAVDLQTGIVEPDLSFSNEAILKVGRNADRHQRVPLYNTHCNGCFLQISNSAVEGKDEILFVAGSDRKTKKYDFHELNGRLTDIISLEPKPGLVIPNHSGNVTWYGLALRKVGDDWQIEKASDVHLEPQLPSVDPLIAENQSIPHNKTFAWDREQLAPVAVSPDGTFIAAGGLVGKIALWRMPTAHKPSEQSPRVDYPVIHPPQRLSTLIMPGFRGGIPDLAFSPDSETLLALDESQRLTLWRVYPQHHWSIETPEVIQHPFAFSPNGEFIAGNGSSGRLIILNSATGELFAELDGYPLSDKGVGAMSAQFVADGRGLVTTGYAGPRHALTRTIFGEQVITVWDVKMKTRLRQWKTELRSSKYWTGSTNAEQLAVSTDGTEVYVANRDDEKTSINTWSIQGDKLISEYHTKFRLLDFSRLNGEVVAFLCGGTIRICKIVDPKSGNELITLANPDKRRELAFGGYAGALSAQIAAIPREDGSVALFLMTSKGETWNIERIEVIRANPDHFVRAVAIADDGRRMVTASNYGTIKLWDIESVTSGTGGQPIVIADFSTPAVTIANSVAISPDGNRFAASHGLVGAHPHYVDLWWAPTDREDLLSAASQLNPRELTSRQRQEYLSEFESRIRDRL